MANAGDAGGSFFADQHINPTNNALIGDQVDPTSPKNTGLSLVSDPLLPTENASSYVTNFDPDLYDLRDTSHLMRLIHALVGSAGSGGIRKQILVARLSSLLSQGAFLDLDRFWGAIFGLQRKAAEIMPQNLDGNTVNPYTDLANSDVWDQVISRDARYRSRLTQLVKAANLGATYAGLKGVAEAILSTEVDISESWVKTDFNYNQHNVVYPTSFTYQAIGADFANYGAINLTYGQLTGQVFGDGQLPAGNRGEVVFTPRRVITQEERYQLQQVLNRLKPANCMITISNATVDTTSTVSARNLDADTEHWQIQNRVTPAHGLVDPAVPIYNNAGPYSQARPVNSDYAGEQWSCNANIATTTAYRMSYNSPIGVIDEETVSYSDGVIHSYVAADGLKDVRQSNAPRLSADGVVTAMPYAEERVTF